MAISDKYIRDFLVNYWDNNGSLRGLSTNANRIYQLIFSRRREENTEKKVNDYIYGVLGVTERGGLGEELTFEIQNHILAYKSLKNIKIMKGYPKMQRVAKEWGVTIEELLSDAGYSNYLHAEPTLFSQKEMNIMYYMCANMFGAVYGTAEYMVVPKLGQYLQENRHFNNLAADEPAVYKTLEQVITVGLGGKYDKSESGATAILSNQKMYFKDTGTELPLEYKVPDLVIEMLYFYYGYVPNQILPPSIRHALDAHLSRYKTLLNMYRVNPGLYATLKTIYLLERKYKSVAEMLRKEGYFYPEMSAEGIELIPCQDKESIVYINDNNDEPILLDRQTLAYLMAEDMLNSLALETFEDMTYVTAMFKNKSKTEVVPFHVLYTQDSNITFKDGNFLNISSNNFRK